MAGVVNDEPVLNTVPPVDALYQRMLPDAVAVSTVVEPLQTESAAVEVVLLGAVGVGVTVTVMAVRLDVQLAVAAST